MDRQKRTLVVVIVTSLLIVAAALALVAGLVIQYFTGNWIMALVAAGVLLVVSLIGLPANVLAVKEAIRTTNISR